VITIRNFGNDKQCQSVDDVLVYIQAYKGKCVSIHDTRPGGKILFVDVLDSGQVRHTYGNQGVIDLRVELESTGGEQ